MPSMDITVVVGLSSVIDCNARKAVTASTAQLLNCRRNVSQQRFREHFHWASGGAVNRPKRLALEIELGTSALDNCAPI